MNAQFFNHRRVKFSHLVLTASLLFCLAAGCSSDEKVPEPNSNAPATRMPKKEESSDEKAKTETQKPARPQVQKKEPAKIHDANSNESLARSIVIDANPSSEPEQSVVAGTLGLGATGAGLGGGKASFERARRNMQAPIGELGGELAPNFNTEGYNFIEENDFLSAKENALSTFSIDVDKASYSNVRRFLNYGSLPQKDAVRIEELVNYFAFDYPQPGDKHPFSITTEVSECAWKPSYRLVQIGIQGKKIDLKDLPPSNIVFLLDVSGSMNDENKLPLVKESMKLLTNELREEDRVSIVVYAGAAGLVLPPTNGDNKRKIIDAFEQLQAGGSTAGGAGIELAYKIARENFVKNGNNRVILCTDGDFNVGLSSEGELVRLIEQKRQSGIYLTVLGFGMGNYKDSKMEQLADKGNGNYAYIDNIQEAKKTLVSEFGGTLFTIAKDVKIQVEFNPAKVKSYRLIGYENRKLKKEDFNDDKKDAGEIGSGHSVTALYEIAPVGEGDEDTRVDDLKYQSNNVKESASNSDEMMTVKFRYKKPDSETSIYLDVPVLEGQVVKFEKSSDDFRFASAVAMFGMLLRDSEHKGESSYDKALALAKNAKGADKEGCRNDFIDLIRKAKQLANPIAEKD
jgi:Ca-activated chloride channel family protein